MITATDPSLVTKELKNRIHDLENTTEILMDWAKSQIVPDIPIAVMTRIDRARWELRFAIMEYMSLDDPLESQIERGRMKREGSGI